MTTSTEDMQRVLDAAKDPESDMMTEMVKELGDQYPTFKTALMDERDLYMLTMLRRCAQEYDSIVAVVGAGHVPGIVQRWNDIEEGRAPDASVDDEAFAEIMMLAPEPTFTDRVVWRLLFIGVPVTVTVAGSVGAFFLGRMAIRAAKRAME